MVFTVKCIHFISIHVIFYFTTARMNISIIFVKWNWDGQNIYHSLSLLLESILIFLQMTAKNTFLELNQLNENIKYSQWYLCIRMIMYNISLGQHVYGNEMTMRLGAIVA